MHIMCGKGNIMKEKNVSLENKVILVTGAAGFIGSNLVMELLREVHPVHIVGIDNMNDYYDVSIKEYRLNQIEELVGKFYLEIYQRIYCRQSADRSDICRG